jgi:hypothetical protein
MKKTTTSNPLKFFNDAKAARNKSFSKSLPKAQDGIASGPLERIDSEKFDRIYNPNTSTVLGSAGPVVLNPEKINDRAELRKLVENNLREDKYYFNRGRWADVEDTIKKRSVKESQLKKGGSVKSKKNKKC